jgi:hypothetical protein
VLEALIYPATVVACLYGPFVSGWEIYEGVLLMYAGIPLAIASAAQAGVARDVAIQEPWRGVLAAAWAAGCTILCIPGIPIGDAVTQAVLGGSVLVLAALFVFLVIARGLLTDRTASLGPRALYATAMLVFGMLFLQGGVRTMSSSDGGPIGSTVAAAQWFRLMVFTGSGLILATNVLVWKVERRRRTRS